MLTRMVEGVTRVIGKSQGYLGLPVRDEFANCTVSGDGTPSMVTAWEPTPDELTRINAGAPILLRVLGSSHPPVMLEVGDALEQVTQPEPVQDGWLPISRYAGEARGVDLWSEQEGRRVTDCYLKYGRWCRFWSDGWSGGGDDIPVDGVTHFREIPAPPTPESEG